MLIPEHLQRALFAHLFPGDGDEHGAVLTAGIAQRENTVDLLVREVHPAIDGVDYVPGARGYRELRPHFIADRIADCRAGRLAYLAVHNHGGDRAVAFSAVDLASHQRGYPALLDLLQGVPAGGLVFAREAAAGDIWFPGGQRLIPTEVRILGSRITRWTPQLISRQSPVADAAFGRQVLMFGDAGQALLRELTVGIIGLGGVGSLVAQFLGKLGVGRLTLVDSDRISITNLSRVVGATRWDARWPLTGPAMPEQIASFAARFASRKTTIAGRLVRRSTRVTQVDCVPESVAVDVAVDKLLGCDYLFVAADSAQARLVCNAIVHQYYIPAIQIGSKIVAAAEAEVPEQAFSVIRRLWPGFGCLWCSGLISPARLAWEAKSAQEQRNQDYGTGSPDPSVITVNAVGAAHAVNEFLFSLLPLRHPEPTPWWAKRFDHTTGTTREDYMERQIDCPECGRTAISRLGAGDARSLPTHVSDAGSGR